MVGSAEPDMPTYEFGCNNCGEVFDHIYQSVPKKMPKTRKCVTCGKKASRLFSVAAIKVSGKVAKIGKSNVMNFYNEAIQDSKDRLDVDQATSPYVKYKPNVGELTKKGVLRKMSDSEVRKQKASEQKFADSVNNLKTKLANKKKK
jgi:putative FmdB family regulatory protein